jgi:[acyl-carrier-protein] S-malonyltransferase
VAVMIAVVAPGQGAQRPGGLAPWLDVTGMADGIARLSEYADMDLAALGTTADASTVTDTAVAQPLIVATGIASGRLLDLDPDRTVWAGHSLGELTVAALSGYLTDLEAMRLAVERGRAMGRASRLQSTGMSVVLGGDRDDVERVLRSLELDVANVNSPEQVVAAGPRERLEQLQGAPPEGARIVPLRVAGAFHTDHMRPAQEAVARFASTLRPGSIAGTLISNADGAVVTSGADALDRLVGQICSPVRWDLTAARLATLGVRSVVEVAPAGTLVGLIRRSHPEIEAVSLRSADDVEVARAKLDVRADGT